MIKTLFTGQTVKEVFYGSEKVYTHIKQKE